MTFLSWSNEGWRYFQYANQYFEYFYYLLQGFQTSGGANQESDLYNRVDAEPPNNILILMSYGGPAPCDSPCAAAFSLIKTGTTQPGGYGETVVPIKTSHIGAFYTGSAWGSARIVSRVRAEPLV